MKLLPARLSTRIVLSMVIAAIVVFSILGTSTGLFFAYHVRQMAFAEQIGRLRDVATAVELSARELESYLIAFTEWREFYRQTAAPEPGFIEAELDPWLPERAEAVALVWARSDGTILHQRGTAEDVSALLGLAERGAVSGAAVLPSGAAVVAISPIVGDPPDVPLGVLAIARPMTERELGGATLVTTGPGDALPASEGWDETTAPDGLAEAGTRFADLTLAARGSLHDDTGTGGVVIEVQTPDPVLGRGRAWLVVIVPITLGLATVGVGMALGVFLSRSIARPLSHFVSYMRDQGYLALQGLRPDEELVLDTHLPDDLRELGQVIVDLMTQLRVNQSDLIEAGEQALAAEQAFRTVVEESPEVKILVREGMVEIANPAAAHFFGLHLGDLIRAEPTGIFAGVRLFDEDDDPVDLADPRVVSPGEPIVVRCVVEGQPDRWIELSVAPLGPESRDYVMSARNVTEERRLEALRQEILSLVSHDLRSPLTVVRGYLDILERDIATAQRQAAIDAARAAVVRMEGLLDDLLNATRAESALAPSVMRPVDLGELAARVTDALAAGSGADIRTELEPGVLVLGDDSRLEQAVTNLVGNALKHGGLDGQVSVAVRSHDGHAELTVRDAGPGVDPGIADRLFERGVRGSAAATPGMGLGLYIVRVVAEAHGGTVTVEEHEGPGAWFLLELPLEHDADEAPAADPGGAG